MRAPLTVLLISILCTACGLLGGRSREDRDRLAFFKRNAGVYFLGDRYEQALDMARRGLEIEPEDYDLLVTSGLCELQSAGDDATQLEDAERFFDRAFAQRNFSDNRPEAILGYATVQQRLGLDHGRRADALKVELLRPDLLPTDRVTRESQYTEHHARALSYWSEARQSLLVLVGREELLRYAHKGLMEIAVELGEYDTAVAEGQACLAQNTAGQATANQVIRETMVPGEELRARAALQELIDQEKRVRAGLAEMHFRQGRYDMAVPHLDALLTLDPTRSADYYNRALALERLDRAPESLRDYEKFLGTTSLPASDERVAHAHAFRSSQRR